MTLACTRQASDNQRMSARPPRGFTLIEVMLVVLIIGILSSFAIPYYQGMTARANRSEAQVVMGKIRVHFISLFESNGTYLTGTQAPGFRAEFNPTDNNVGQGAPWNPAAAGWTDMTFPPEGNIKLRYSYSIPAPNQLVLTACGSFPGFGAATLACSANLNGNYLYREAYQNTSLDPAATVELPSF